MDFGSLDFNVGAEGMAKQDQKKKKIRQPHMAFRENRSVDRRY